MRSARASHPAAIEPAGGETPRYARAMATRAASLDWPALGVAGERAFQRLSGLVGLSRPPRGGAQQLEVTRPQPTVVVGRDERVHRLRPGVPVHGVATQLDCLDHRARYPLTWVAPSADPCIP